MSEQILAAIYLLASMACVVFAGLVVRMLEIYVHLFKSYIPSNAEQSNTASQFVSDPTLTLVRHDRQMSEQCRKRTMFAYHVSNK